MTRRLLRVGILFSSLLWIGCGGSRQYETYIPIKEEGWKMTDSLVFSLPETKESTASVSQIAVRYNEVYPFSNLYLRVILKDSAEQPLENKLINMPLFDSKSGKPLGKGFGSSFTKMDTLPFDWDASTREVVIYQYMRQENLKGLESVGVKVSRRD